jgi:hypothetical protein
MSDSIVTFFTFNGLEIGVYFNLVTLTDILSSIWTPTFGRIERVLMIILRSQVFSVMEGSGSLWLVAKRPKAALLHTTNQSLDRKSDVCRVVI